MSTEGIPHYVRNDKGLIQCHSAHEVGVVQRSEESLPVRSPDEFVKYLDGSIRLIYTNCLARWSIDAMH
jgi:hypothetical protein